MTTGVAVRMDSDSILADNEFGDEANLSSPFLSPCSLPFRLYILQREEYNIHLYRFVHSDTLQSMLVPAASPLSMLAEDAI